MSVAPLALIHQGQTASEVASVAYGSRCVNQVRLDLLAALTLSRGFHRLDANARFVVARRRRGLVDGDGDPAPTAGAPSDPPPVAGGGGEQDDARRADPSGGGGFAPVGSAAGQVDEAHPASATGTIPPYLIETYRALQRGVVTLHS